MKKAWNEIKTCKNNQELDCALWGSMFSHNNMIVTNNTNNGVLSIITDEVIIEKEGSIWQTQFLKDRQLLAMIKSNQYLVLLNISLECLECKLYLKNNYYCTFLLSESLEKVATLDEDFNVNIYNIIFDGKDYHADIVIDKVIYDQQLYPLSFNDDASSLLLYNPYDDNLYIWHNNNIISLDRKYHINHPFWNKDRLLIINDNTIDEYDLKTGNFTTRMIITNPPKFSAVLDNNIALCCEKYIEVYKDYILLFKISLPIDIYDIMAFSFSEKGLLIMSPYNCTVYYYNFNINKII